MEQPSISNMNSFNTALASLQRDVGATTFNLLISSYLAAPIKGSRIALVETHLSREKLPLLIACILAGAAFLRGSGLFFIWAFGCAGQMLFQRDAGPQLV